MSHMITRQGRDHYLSGEEVRRNTIDLYDVAHALSMINRFTGHTKRPYSVAEHSLLTAELAAHDGKSALIQLLCLMHDGHEAYAGDASSPVKHAVGLAWAQFEHLQADCVRRHFGLTTGYRAYRQLVTHYDLVALATERRDLTAYKPAEHLPWLVLDAPGAEVPPASFINLNSLARLNSTWLDWKNLFISEFLRLTDAVKQQTASLTTSPT